MDDLFVPVKDVIYAHSTNKYKPNNDNWSKHKSNLMSPIVLQHEKAYQYSTCSGNWYI